MRSPYVMAEYWKRPEQTASTLRDGWLHTDDIARADDRGYMFILDRKKDMIVSGGFQHHLCEEWRMCWRPMPAS